MSVFQKCAFSPGGSTILKDSTALKSIKNGSERVLERHFFHLVFCLRFWSLFGSILEAFWLPKWGQVGVKIEEKNDRKKGCSSRAAKMGQRVVLGGSWGRLGVPWRGSGAAPGTILEAFWGQKSVFKANQQCWATNSSKDKLEQQKATEKDKVS